MTDAPREHLIILDSSLANQALGQLEAVATVTQVLPPRLVLIEADPGVRERLVGIAGVMGDIVLRSSEEWALKHYLSIDDVEAVGKTDPQHSRR